MNGTITINKQTYVEREQSFPLEITMTQTTPNVTKVSLVLGGVADFLLKSLTREVVAAGVSAQRRFRFRLGNTDGNTFYQAGGVGGTTDRVIDTLIFGSGQFPFVLCPYIYYSASASILCEFEDLSNSFPYTIACNFRGSYLIPAGN